MYTRTITFRSDELTDEEIKYIKEFLKEKMPGNRRKTDTDIIKLCIDFVIDYLNKSNKSDSS